MIPDTLHMMINDYLLKRHHNVTILAWMIIVKVTDILTVEVEAGSDSIRIVVHDMRLPVLFQANYEERTLWQVPLADPRCLEKLDTELRLLPAHHPELDR